MKRWIAIAAVALFAGLANAAPGPYDEHADAEAGIQHALVEARQANVPVLVVFGANWCPDCRALDEALAAPETAALMSSSFRVVKVDVGNFDRNLELSRRWGDPIKKGIPAAVLLSADGQVLYATRAGELANARGMSRTGIYDFFKKISDGAPRAR